MNNKSVIYLLVLNVLLLSSAYTMVMPFLPLYLEKDLGAHGDSITFYATLCYSSTFLVSTIATPLWGHFADKYGKKNMLMRVCLLLLLSYSCAYFSQTPLQLCLSRALQGLSSGMTPAILALISVTSEKNKAGFYLSLIQSANICGTILGPILGGIVAQYLGVRNCFLITLCVTLLISIFNFIFIKEPKINLNNQVKTDESYLDILKDPIMRSLLLCIIINAMVIMLLVPLLQGYIETTFKLDNSIEVSGFIFALSGIAGAIASPIWGYLGCKKGFLTVLLLGSLIASITYLSLTFVTDIYLFATLWFIAGLCICSIAPAVHAITAKHFSDQSATKAYSIIYSGQQIGNLLGPIIGGLSVTYLGLNSIFLNCSICLSIVSAYLASVAFIRNYN